MENIKKKAAEAAEAAKRVVEAGEATGAAAEVVEAARAVEEKAAEVAALVALAAEQLAEIMKKAEEEGREARRYRPDIAMMLIEAGVVKPEEIEIEEVNDAVNNSPALKK